MIELYLKIALNEQGYNAVLTWQTCFSQTLQAHDLERLIEPLLRQSSRQEGVLDNFFYFSSKPYVVTPHLNRLEKTVQMRGTKYVFVQN